MFTICFTVAKSCDANDLTNEPFISSDFCSLYNIMVTEMYVTENCYG